MPQRTTWNDRENCGFADSATGTRVSPLLRSSVTDLFARLFQNRKRADFTGFGLEIFFLAAAGSFGKTLAQLLQLGSASAASSYFPCAFNASHNSNRVLHVWVQMLQ